MVYMTFKNTLRVMILFILDFKPSFILADVTCFKWLTVSHFKKKKKKKEAKVFAT
jgi:hypothetical protein